MIFTILLLILNLWLRESRKKCTDRRSLDTTGVNKPVPCRVHTVRAHASQIFHSGNTYIQQRSGATHYI